jgi:hypothetical protein
MGLRNLVDFAGQVCVLDRQSWLYQKLVLIDGCVLIVEDDEDGASNEEDDDEVSFANSIVMIIGLLRSVHAAL